METKKDNRRNIQGSGKAQSPVIHSPLPIKPPEGRLNVFNDPSLARVTEATTLKLRDPEIELDGTMTLTDESGNPYLYINGYSEGRDVIGVPYHKLFTYIRHLLCQTVRAGEAVEVNKTISFSISEYMELCGVKRTKDSRKNFIRQLRRNIALMRRTAIFLLPNHWRGNQEDMPYEEYGTVIGSKREGDFFSLTLHQKFVNRVSSAYIQKVPPFLFRLDNNNMTAMSLAEKLCHIYTMSSNEDKTKDGWHIISVEKLLEACPIIPSKEEVRRTDRRLSERIIKPLEYGLSEAERASKGKFQWEYCQAKQLPLSQEILDASDTREQRTAKNPAIMANTDFFFSGNAYIRFKIDFSE